MKLAFAGTPEFGAVMLDALVRSRHCVEAVFTRRDARAGRGKRVTQSPVKRRALAAGIEVHQPRSMRIPEVEEMLAVLDLDVLVVAAYGFLLPPSILAMPRHGCINVHASVLPRWRGAAPIHHAILAGDTGTGVSIMRMESGLDTGPILATRTCTIAPKGHHGLADQSSLELGAAALTEPLRTRGRRRRGSGTDETRATHAPKLSKSQAEIDWTRPRDRHRTHGFGRSTRGPSRHVRGPVRAPRQSESGARRLRTSIRR